MIVLAGVLRGHLGHPSAGMFLSPDTKGGFSLELPGAGHSLTSACRLMPPDPKEARFSGQDSPAWQTPNMTNCLDIAAKCRWGLTCGISP